MEFFFFLFSLFSIIGLAWAAGVIALAVIVYLIVNRLNESKSENFERRKN